MNNVCKNNKSGLVSLFVEGQPIVFEVQRYEESFHFEPLISWKDLVKASGFSLERKDTYWTTSTHIDRDLFYQAVEEVETWFQA